MKEQSNAVELRSTMNQRAFTISSKELVDWHIPAIRKLFLFVLLLLPSHQSLLAESSQENPIQQSRLLITNAYMPEISPVSRTAVVYLTIKNLSEDSSVTIESIETEIANHAMFHQTYEVEHTVKMKHLETIEIAPNQTLELAPSGMHIMLMGLNKQPFPKPFELWLIFDDQTKQMIKVDVRAKKN